MAKLFSQLSSFLLFGHASSHNLLGQPLKLEDRYTVQRVNSLGVEKNVFILVKPWFGKEKQT